MWISVDVQLKSSTSCLNRRLVGMIWSSWQTEPWHISAYFPRMTHQMSPGRSGTAIALFMVPNQTALLHFSGYKGLLVNQESLLNSPAQTVFKPHALKSNSIWGKIQVEIQALKSVWLVHVWLGLRQKSKSRQVSWDTGQYLSMHIQYVKSRKSLNHIYKRYKHSSGKETWQFNSSLLAMV